MKNILKSALFLCVTVLSLGSCEEDKVIFDSRNGESIAAFRTAAYSLPVTEEGVSSIELVVDVTTVSNVDRAIAIEIAPETTALPNEYTLDQATLVVPAGQYNGLIKITGHFDELPALTVRQLVINLEDVAGARLVDGTTTATITLSQSCPVIRDQLIGTYDAIETPGPYAYVCEVTAGAGPNDLIVSNVWDADPNSVTKISLSSNPLNTTVTLPVYTENYLYNNTQYGAAYVEANGGASFVDPCTSTITLKFRIRVSAGTFAPNVLVLTKQ
jgi:hypothetical protein